MHKALADDFPLDLPQLIDGVAPNEGKKNERCVWIYFYFVPPAIRRRETHPLTNAPSSLCVSCTRANVRADDRSSFRDKTHTYICYLCLSGWSERRASFAKVSAPDRLQQGDEWLMEAQRGGRGNN